MRKNTLRMGSALEMDDNYAWSIPEMEVGKPLDISQVCSVVRASTGAVHHELHIWKMEAACGSLQEVCEATRGTRMASHGPLPSAASWRFVAVQKITSPDNVDLLKKRLRIRRYGMRKLFIACVMLGY